MVTIIRSGGLERLLLFAAGVLPFFQVHRLPPMAAFWGEWAAVVLFSAWLVLRRWRAAVQPPAREAVPWTAGAFLSLALIAMAQAAMGLGAYPTSAAVVAFELVLAALVCAEAAGARRQGGSAEVLEAFAWGVALALLMNALSVALRRLGVELNWIDLASDLHGGRDAALVGQANHLGVLAVLAWAGFGYLHARARVGRATYLLFSALAGVVCASSASRTALVALALAIATQLVYRKRSSLERPGLGSPIPLATLVLGSTIFLLTLMAWALSQEPGAAGAPSVLRTSISGRYEMLRDAILIGLQHPVWGIGFGNYASGRLFELNGSLPYPNANHAHNLFGQVWAEWGGLGAAAVLAACAVVAWSLMTRWLRGPRSPEVALCASWVLALLAHSQVEFPLWLAYYLLPFALMLGLIEQPDLVLRAARPARRWAVGTAGVLVMFLCAAAAWDYRRSERLATQTLLQLKQSPKGVAYIPTAQAMRVAQLTLFPGSAEMMHARALVLDNMLPDFKLDVAERALKTIAAPETMARYIVLLAMNGRTEDARGFLDMLRRRNPGVAMETEKSMELMAASNAFLEAFVAATLEGGKPAARASDGH